MPNPLSAPVVASATFRAFPDMVVTRTNRVVGGDSVAGEVGFAGTNSGPMRMAGKEIPPTGKSILGRGAYFARIRDGKIAEFKAIRTSPG